MEHIKKAIERAKQERLHVAVPFQPPAAAGGTTPKAPAVPGNDARRAPAVDSAKVVSIDRRHLQAMRIVAYDPTELRSNHFDMLRTQVLQRMEAASFQMIAVTSPRVGCGKSITAINLAMSMARQSEQSVLLVDLDLRKPQIARYLGLSPKAGIHDVLADKCVLSEALLTPDLCGHRLAVLACPNRVANPTEQLVSSAMKATLTGLKKAAGYKIIIFDLPPMLSSDDFLAFLPQVDCALLVASSGESTVHDIAECERLIDPEKFLGCVLNKVTEAGTAYYNYG
jgi:protein-tyrosine kinase